MTKFIDLNCDIGEHENDEGAQREAAIMPHVSSANVACGLHAGDAACRAHVCVGDRVNRFDVGAITKRIRDVFKQFLFFGCRDIGTTIRRYKRDADPQRQAQVRHRVR